VPTLVTDDHIAVTDSTAILAVIDDMAGPGRASLARSGREGREVARICGFAGGAADKGVSLLYERVLREAAFPMWVERCTTQIGETLDLLEGELVGRASPYLFGDALSHADVMLAVMWTFIAAALSAEFDGAKWPALASHAARCEALPAFQAIYQPFKLTQPGEG
jgi:glutathione S-transferase